MPGTEKESKSRPKRALVKALLAARTFYADFQEFLAPSSCLCCGRERDFPDPLLCPACLESLRKKNTGGGPICPFCGLPSGIGLACERGNPDPLDLYFWGYYEDELRECLQQFKFHKAIELGKRLTDMAMNSPSMLVMLKGYDMIIPVPLHKGRQRERLYNQSEIIAREIGQALGVNVIPDALVRCRPTRQQAKLDEAARWNNVRDAFVIAPDSIGSFSGKRILLVDDIVTTGATIYEASRMLRAAGPERLDIFSLAYAK